ncbi:MAG: nucleic acid-binding protein [Spirochaetes bacterium GWD1_27_9]|nr:MAG: nucleic acid-binding protein [Spirochaetes bacterium GWB1_27_13]OHD26372.1 MAG: nucleic acid-binding protein [Spirochaetes bacterium GWC1_27_15]OHD42112.1 MAG: nucleic acid-binding protein [Spirochaetes bacterium GWD1_27_9]
MAYLIDTDIIIYSLKNNEIVINNFKSFSNYPKAISVISYGELYFGAKKSKNIEKNTAIVKRISETFEIIKIDKTIIELFGEIKAKMQQTGNITSDFDLLIGVTALSYNYTLITNNENHFNKIDGLKIENWSNPLPKNDI